MTLDSGLRRNDLQGIMLYPRIFEHTLLERNRREVRGKTQVHLPDRLIPGIGGEGMMPQYLDVAEIAL